MGVTLHVVIFFFFNYGTKSCKAKQMDYFDATNYCTEVFCIAFLKKEISFYAYFLSNISYSSLINFVYNDNYQNIVYRK